MRFPALLPGLLVVACLLAPLGPARTSAATTEPASAARSTATLRLETDVMILINHARSRAGCPSLRVNSPLRAAARRHSALMATRSSLSHRLSGEAGLQSRISAAGYTGATMVGEVIAYGPRSASDVVRLWLRSAPHRRILLNCRFRHVGAGLVIGSGGRYWWTVDLGRP